jgi:hypothetical protein
MSEMPGQAMAAHRLMEADGSIYNAFDALDVFGHEIALDYLAAPLERIPAEHRGFVAGVALGLALTAVEADRERTRHIDALKRAAGTEGTT